MKPSQRIATLLASSLILAGAVEAQSSSSAPASTASDLSGITRVTKDAVKDNFTAKDLIGSAVYDRAGEKIGDISDIDLKGAIPEDLAKAFKAAQVDDDRPATPMAGTTPAPDTDTGESMTDAAKRTARNMSAAVSSALSNASVLVSVGGLWGVGDDLISVPVSELSYNATEERFELSVNKADVVALAEGESSEGYAAGSTRSETSAGKQSFADEASRVQDAIANDPQTSAFAYKVTVTTDGESLEIHGMVDNKEQKEHILDAARRATSLEVEDEIDVR